MAITKRYRTFDKSWMIETPLQKLRTLFKKPALAATLSAGILSGFSAAAQADHGQCAPLEHTAYGLQLGASSSAHKFSKENIGSIGISVFPGADLYNFNAHELGSKLVSLFEQHGVDAECYVHGSQFEDSGTALGFKVAGLSISVDGDNSFGMGDVREDKRILEYALAEAKTAGQLLVSEEPQNRDNQEIAALTR